MQTEINENRRQLPAADYCIRVADGTHDSPKASESGKPLITSRHIKNGQIDISNAYLISQEDFDDINRRSKVNQWDILISMIGTVGEVCLVSQPNPDFAIKNVGLFKNKNEVDGKWLYYYLKSSIAQNIISSRKKGTTQQYISLGELRQFPVIEPVIPDEKENIVKILSSLDDKIELNWQMNATLEAIARALFKAWFVDFEPVRANSENRPSESASPEIAKLFPSEFENDIPKGWKLSTIGEEVEVVGGGTPSTKESSYWNGKHNWVTPKDLSNSTDKVLISSDRTITEEGLAKISSGELPIDTVLLSSRAPVGYLTMAKIPVSINQGFIAMKCNKLLPPTYVLHWTEQSMDKIKNRASGTTFAEISKTNFRPLSVVVPSETVIEKYDVICKLLYDKITINAKANETLSKLRDELLPKLIQGKIKVSNL